MSEKPIGAKIPGECPECDSSNVKRIARKGAFEKLLYPLMGVWPYRCGGCNLKCFDYCGVPQAFVPIARAPRCLTTKTKTVSMAANPANSLVVSIKSPG